MEGVHRFGQGPETALALHCALASGMAWRGVGERLGDLLTLTAPDHPGHGTAPDWDGTGEYGAVALERALEAMDGPGVLIGHSFGGVVALRLAAARPDLVRRLVLIEPVWFRAAEGTEAFEQLQADMVGLAAKLEEGPEPAARYFTDIWGTGRPWEALDARTRAYTADRMHLVIAAETGNFGDPAGLAAPGGLEGLTMPVLLAAGSESHPVQRAVNDALAARLPHARQVIWDGAGHLAPITKPDVVARTLREFLTE
ncbi:alpha/beta fold hydrolase [Tropicimonas sp. IMCC34011]|uniref:alpha/beta fold hydrolase n=1 Tax=Tropicimonas sp. IMCC34011 TaxID=2248759 RepID=UPI001E502E88|nr:alpha/beta hydrolase [Tropicimonas sp. IMCC34011]